MDVLKSVLGALLLAGLCASQCNKKAKQYDALLGGEITSPSYNKGKYSTNLNCVYKLKAPAGYRIKITFKDLDIVPSTSCTSDKLVIHGKDKDSIIGVFCGNQIPRPVLSHEEENEIQLIFQTGYPKTARGFKIKYEAALHYDLCAQDEGVCRNRNCYNIRKICDGVDDCGDGTDEEDCGHPAVVVSKCGSPPINPSTIYGAPDRMIGGTTAVPNSWPWQASIQLKHIEPNGHFCGGALVNSQWVVTAARCFLDAPHPRSIKVTVGSHKMFGKTKYEQVRIADKIIAYPDLEEEELKKASLVDDMAMIKLNAPIMFNDGVQPVCLPYEHWAAKPGWKCYASGWGETKGSGFSDELKQTLLEIRHVDHCSHDETRQLCVEMESSSACQDDSGGPLVCKLASQWYLMGTVSTGAKENPRTGLCSGLDSKILFAKVSHKSEWIRQIINKYS